MKKISRRKFLKKSIAGGTLIALNAGKILGQDFSSKKNSKLEQIVLGKSGVRVSRLALGTGTNGWKFKSDQTALGDKGFIDLALHAYEAGVTFIDAADIYGSHRNVQQLLRHIPREKIVILTKIWTQPNDWIPIGSTTGTIDRFRKEIGTDYLDIVLLHCQTSSDWVDEHAKVREALSKAKTDGIITAHGVSCHSLSALKAAAGSDWVDVIFSRINNNGNRMDDTPQNVMPVLKQAHDSGKGVVGMKIFGCGELIDEAQRQASLQYVLKSKNVDAMTIGFESKDQIDDTVKRVTEILGEG
jgi:aryl-alcohol dehydrogenase-like predicted oxidoreductase